MPQVPAYDRQRVAPEATPNARLNVQSSGSLAQIGAVGMQAGANIIKEERDKADEIAVMGFDRQLTEHSNNALYGPDGVLNKKGKDALGAPEEVLPAFDKFAAEVEATANGPRQKFLFMRLMQQRRAHLDLVTQRHVASERQAYDAEETTQGVQVQRNAAAFNYNDPSFVQASIDKQVAIIQSFGKRNGKGAEWVSNQTDDAISKTHLQVIERALASGADQYASAYYKEVKDQIKSNEATRAAELVQAGSYQGESQRIMDEWSKDGMTREWFQNEVKTIKDPKLRDAVQNRADAYFSRVHMMEQARNEDAFKYATLVVTKGGQYESIPVGIQDQLTLAQKTGLRAYTKSLERGQKIETDITLYTKLMDMAGTDPNKFIEHDLLQYIGRLDESDFKHFTSLKNSLRNKDKNAQDKIDGWMTTRDIVNGALNSAGIDPTPKPGKEAERVAKFNDIINKKYITYREQNGGKKPDDNIVKGWVDEQLMQGRVPGSVFTWWGTDKRVFELAPGDKPTFKYDQIPLARRKQIENAIIRDGGKVTNEEVTRLYNRFVVEQANK